MAAEVVRRLAESKKKTKEKKSLNPVFTVYLIQPDERAHRGLLLEGHDGPRTQTWGQDRPPVCVPL